MKWNCGDSACIIKFITCDLSSPLTNTQPDSRRFFMFFSEFMPSLAVLCGGHNVKHKRKLQSWSLAESNLQTPLSATLFFTFFVLRVHHKVPLWKTEEDCASEVNEKYTQKRERRAIESARKKIFKMSRNKNSFTIGNRLRVLQRERERAREIFHHHNSRQLYFIYKHCSVFALFTLSIDGPVCAVWGGRGRGRWNENFTNHENEIIDRSS